MQLPEGILDEQAERVPVAGNGMRAGLDLSHEPVGEEAGQQAGELGDGAHDGSLPRACSTRLAASWSSSGMAVQYQ